MIIMVINFKISLSIAIIFITADTSSTFITFVIHSLICVSLSLLCHLVVVVIVVFYSYF